MSYETSTARWVAVASRDKAADGVFFYAVKSTRIYCRPVCAARLARRANVEFYQTAAEAESAGYRACKRCKPESAERKRDPQDETVKTACDVIAKVAREGRAHVPGEKASDIGMDSREGKGLGLKELAEQVGKTPRYLHKIFKDRMGVTPKQYAEQMHEMYHPVTTAPSTRADAPDSNPTTTFQTRAWTPFNFEEFDADLDLDLEWGTEQQTEAARELDELDRSDGGTISPDESIGLPLTPTTLSFDPFQTSLNQFGLIQETALNRIASLTLPNLQTGEDTLKLSPALDGSDWLLMDSIDTSMEAPQLI